VFRGCPCPVVGDTALVTCILRTTCSLLLATYYLPPGSSVSRVAVPAGGRVLVVGDTHGHLKDVVHLFKTHGMPSPANVYVFNGDISDRSDTPARGGMHSVVMHPTQFLPTQYFLPL
jgi:hypothetical protein